MKHDANFWREECNYISRVTMCKGHVPEMNYDLDAFIRYCEMQRGAARRDGFFDAEAYIEQCLNDLRPEEEE